MSPGVDNELLGTLAVSRSRTSAIESRMPDSGVVDVPVPVDAPVG